ncbi:hypothetical protein NUU61_010099 [Penicillium alfredii]|uniref:Major facilitator superfamily (MFS) profile domain-containing protein n=1 Tax=Penicillium alfredii TaxID=1506179 RepID=A0A9W9EHM0_9EURO|nr:uncharacterized protein NUU61_010099 [Penicillium alfredii]KAJ5081835.1 hypothetical protein NUU61_010099 [Penicillium alfredii]
MVINCVNQPRYKRSVKKNNRKAVPEARLPPMVTAPEYLWPLPVVAAGFIGAGFTIVFQQCLNFLVDTYGVFAASAVSANTILRSVLACALPMAVRPMFKKLGVGSASSCLGGISCLSLPVPLLFMKYGALLRKKSRFAPKTSR